MYPMYPMYPCSVRVRVRVGGIRSACDDGAKCGVHVVTNETRRKISS